MRENLSPRAAVAREGSLGKSQSLEDGLRLELPPWRNLRGIWAEARDAWKIEKLLEVETGFSVKIEDEDLEREDFRSWVDGERTRKRQDKV